MKVQEAVNRLTREIKKSLPYWEERKPEWDALNDDEKQEHLVHSIIEDDAEVQDALYYLIEAIQEEQWRH